MAAPAAKIHEVALRHPARHRGMSIGVAELMGVDALADAREAAPSSDHLLDARPSEASFTREPKLGSSRMTVRGAEP